MAQRHLIPQLSILVPAFGLLVPPLGIFTPSGSNLITRDGVLITLLSRPIAQLRHFVAMLGTGIVSSGHKAIFR